MKIRIEELRAMVAKRACDAEWTGKKPVRLKHCTAWVIDLGDIKVLKSYHTYVACMYNGYVVAFNSYSTTTQQHIHKFAKEYNATGIMYAYPRTDHKIWCDFQGFPDEYLTYKAGKECGYVNEVTRREMNRDLRENARLKGFEQYLVCPDSMVDDYVLLSANYEEIQSFVNRWYSYTCR